MSPYLVIFGTHLVIVLAALLIGGVVAWLLRQLRPRTGRLELFKRLLLAVLPGFALGGSLAMWLLAEFAPVELFREPPRGSVSEGDVFVAMAFGIDRAPDGAEAPGPANLALARWLVENNPDHKPVVAQRGVCLALEELHAGPAALAGSAPSALLAGWLFPLPEREGVYVSTHDGVFQAWAAMEPHGWQKPVLVAHDLHLKRVAWEFEKIFPPSELVVPEMPPTPFDPASAQHFGTKTRRGWVVWELLLARPTVLPYSLLALLIALETAVAVVLLRLLLRRAPDPREYDYGGAGSWRPRRGS